MSTFPLVSIVIVSWNAREYLAECLESLRSGVYAGPTETIVVDNASADGSAEMVRQQFPEVMLIQNPENFGFAKANNIAIRQCKGRYIALVNSDVHVLKDCISDLVAHCESHPEVGIVGPRVIGGDGQQQRSCRGFPRLWNMLCRALALDSIFPDAKCFNGYLLPNWDHDSCIPVDILSGCFWVVRRDALNDVGLLDESFFIYGEDMDWCKRFWKAGWPAVFVPQAQAIHYGGASSANAPVRFFIEMQRADLQYWTKHHSRLAVGAYSAICLLNHGLRAIGFAFAFLFARQSVVAREHKHKVERSVACLKWMVNGWRHEARA